MQQPARLTIPWEPSVACCTPKALHWVPEWSNNLDPSGRAAWGVHNAANDLVTADAVEDEAHNNTEAKSVVNGALNGGVNDH